jgi:hypothetical protein
MDGKKAKKISKNGETGENATGEANKLGGRWKKWLSLFKLFWMDNKKVARLKRMMSSPPFPGH